jgi:hypothetical protein
MADSRPFKFNLDVAYAGNNTISFVGINSGDNSAFVDDVQLTLVPNVQPLSVGVIRWDYGWGQFGASGEGGAWDYQFNLVDFSNRSNPKWSTRWPFFTNASAQLSHLA